MNMSFKAPVTAVLLLTGLTTAASADHVFYTLNSDGSALLSVPAGSIMTATATSTGITLGGAPLSVDALTFRPQTGELYAYDASSQRLYTVDPATGTATLEFESSDLPGDGAFVQFDTNPNLDAFRFIDSGGTNTVYFPDDTANGTPANAGRLIAETIPAEANNIAPLTYGAGYTVTGTPTLIGNAYTNQLALTKAQAQPDALLQYVLDADTDTLGILNNNAGTVDFVANILGGFDLAGGFDIFTAGDGSDTAYANLSIGGIVQGLFEIDLAVATASGEAVLDPLFVFDQPTTSLAVFIPQADMAAVPLPASGLLLIAGLGGLAAARRRKV